MSISDKPLVSVSTTHVGSPSSLTPRWRWPGGALSAAAASSSAITRNRSSSTRETSETRARITQACFDAKTDELVVRQSGILDLEGRRPYA
ncbi:hypothetical protein INS49_005003 [Diaporthe citri]|uniref:uncharacterized protein n=1 Tax=Diaporthe citri TaxID=83186 RepID=UPI001C8073C9|nr:uncharacterized protein INS49_005003 [Diaporthe citri]KAG6354032.1 hypothetical protein INS49_005003 [Diaporthe citri]